MVPRARRPGCSLRHVPPAADSLHRSAGGSGRCAMSSNAMRDTRFCWAGRFCKRLWPFLVAKAVCSTKTAPTQHNDGVNCDQLVRLLEPIAQPTPVFRPFFARSPKVLTKRFTWHPKTSRSRLIKADHSMILTLSEFAGRCWTGGSLIELWDSILDYFFINHTLTRARWPNVPPFRSHRQPAALLSEAYSLHRITSPLSTLP